MALLLDQDGLTLAEAGPEQHAVLGRLAQFYIYDFAAFMEWKVGEDGAYADHGFAASLRRPNRRAFLLRAGGELAGFALVDRGSRLRDAPEVWDMVTGGAFVEEAWDDERQRGPVQRFDTSG